MLDRLRRKLFLSLKVMSSSSSTQDEESAQLKTAELMDILRKGSSAIAEGGMDLGRFLVAPIDEILHESRQRENARNVQIKRVSNSIAADSSADTANSESGCKQDISSNDAEEERQLLSGVAQVQSRLFEGRVIQRTQNNRDIADEWQDLQKRARADRLVEVDGIMVVAAQIADGAVSTTTSSSLPQKRSRPKFESEDWCIYCRDGGEVVVCNLCPRVFHLKCHGITRAQLKRLPSIPCSQHNCAECGRNTAQSGGMLFRCQTCPKAFCEDCLPEGDLDAVGDVLPEFLLLGYGAQTTAYYIRCHSCHAYWAEHPETKEEEMVEIQQKIEALGNDNS